MFVITVYMGKNSDTWVGVVSEKPTQEDLAALAKRLGFTDDEDNNDTIGVVEIEEAKSINDLGPILSIYKDGSFTLVK